MKKKSVAEQLSVMLKKELNKPKLSRIRRMYLTQKIKLIEEYFTGRSK